MQSARARWVFAFLMLACGVVSREARADSVVQCASAADQAQQLRDDGHYAQARSQFLLCASAACPAPIKRDCLEWINQLESATPTIVLEAKADGFDVEDVSVRIDDVLVASKLDGKPLQLDPGKHLATFERGGQRREQAFMLGAGQKNRTVGVAFNSPSSRVEAPSKSSVSFGAKPPPPRTSYVLPIIATGVGAVALAVFGYAGLTGRADVSDLDLCKPRCASASVDDARTTFLVADISLLIGAIAMSAATYFFVRPLTTTREPSNVQATGTRRGSRIGHAWQPHRQ
jgi:hypothetical protein